MQCMSAPLTMSSCTLSGHNTSRNQRESPLLRLPPELRDKIYRHALSGHKIHVRCRYRRGQRYLELQQPPHNLTALNGVSRQIHSETANLCVALITFAGDVRVLKFFFKSFDERVAMNLSNIEVVLYGCDVFLEEGNGLSPEVYETRRYLRLLPNLKSVVVSWGCQTNAGAVNKMGFDLVEDAFRLPSRVNLQVLTYKDIEEWRT